MNKLIVGLIGAAILAGCNTCKTVDSGMTFAQEVLAPYVKAGELPGAVNVFYKDGAQETCCIGFADVAAQRAITLDDVFMQCSQTKGFCGVTVAMLVEAGKLKLDDPVSKHLPEFAELWIQTSKTNDTRVLAKAKNALTLRMCLNHTGGFRFELANYEQMGGYSLGLSAPVDDSESAWFGHGGAFGTNCMVNWHRKELSLWVVQMYGGPYPWTEARAEASRRFFSRTVDDSGVRAYTGRMK